MKEGIVGKWSVKMVLVSRSHLGLKAHTEICTPGHWRKSTYHQAVGLRTIAIFTVKRQPWAVVVPYCEPYFHQDLRPYIYGAITAMSNIAWSRLKPPRLGLDSLFDTISAVRPYFPHLPIARRRPPTAYISSLTNSFFPLAQGKKAAKRDKSDRLKKLGG